MAYNTDRERVVLFGGSNGTTLSDAWEYDGTTWSRDNLTPHPSGRSASAMTYDAARQSMLLFGGGRVDNISQTWTLGAAPSRIRRHPISRYISQGLYTDLNVVADGPPPLSYRWQRNGVPLGDTANLIGTRSNVLQIRSLTPDLIGLYACEVTDACGNSLITSTVAVAFCGADFNADSAIDTRDLFDFLAAYFAADPRADLDSANGVSVQDLFNFVSGYLAGCP